MVCIVDRYKNIDRNIIVQFEIQRNEERGRRSNLVSNGDPRSRYGGHVIAPGLFRKDTCKRRRTYTAMAKYVCAR